ncbi:MAG: glycosyltransferase family 2 protein [Candidatus Saccharimonadales bacterium]
MMWFEIVFGVGAVCAVYTYLFYPLMMAGRARWRACPARAAEGYCPSVSIIVAAHNEEHQIGRRVAELAAMIDRGGVAGEVIVVSDGSTDGTAAMAASASTAAPVRVLDLGEKTGKAAALNLGVEMARHEIVVFADARQRWSPDALNRLIENFADPEVGAVSGELLLERSPGEAAGVGLYWRYEKWLRRSESRVHAMPGVTGAISAVRKALFRPMPRGLVLDDVYWPLQVAMQGYRVVFDDRAKAYDRLPPRARDEFRRKVRTLSGNLQLVAALPGLLDPRRNPIWLAVVSHKLLRLAVPWALLVMLVASGCLWDLPLYRALFAAQLAFYGAATVGLILPGRFRLTSAAASFVLLNGAAWIAPWIWLRGGSTRSWGKVVYSHAAPAARAPVMFAEKNTRGWSPASGESGDATPAVNAVYD